MDQASFETTLNSGREQVALLRSARMTQSGVNLCIHAWLRALVNNGVAIQEVADQVEATLRREGDIS